MATWAQVVNGQALNVIVGNNLASAFSQHFAPGFDGGHPGIEWSEVPDGTLSGAATNDGQTFSNPIPLTPPNPTTISAVAFIKRLTVAEKAAIMGSADNVVKAFLFELQAAASGAEAINLLDPDTIAGVNYLETPGALIASGRAAQILTP